MNIKNVKKLIENQIKLLKEQNEDCNDNVFLVLSLDNYNVSLSYSYNELASYMNTGDSGEYGTQVNITMGNSTFPQNLPNVFGVNTEDYGISNKNDLLNIVADQNSLSLTLPDLGFGNAGTIFWSLGGSFDFNEISLEEIQNMVTMCSKGVEGEEEEEEEETDLDVLCADVWGPYGNALVTGCNDPLALNYDPCVNASCSWNLTDTSCCEYPSCEDLATQPEHLGCCAKCDSPDFNPEEDPTCASHCECCGDNYMRYTCSSQGICLSGPNPDYPFETLEECENSCGEPGGVTDYTGPVFPTMGGTPNTGTPIKDPIKSPFKDKPKRAFKTINRLKELAGIKKPKI